MFSHVTIQLTRVSKLLGTVIGVVDHYQPQNSASLHYDWVLCHHHLMLDLFFLLPNASSLPVNQTLAADLGNLQ